MTPSCCGTSLLFDWLALFIKALVCLEVSLFAEGSATLHALHLSLGNPRPCTSSSIIFHLLLSPAPVHLQPTSAVKPHTLLTLHSTLLLTHQPSSLCHTLVTYMCVYLVILSSRPPPTHITRHILLSCQLSAILSVALFVALPYSDFVGSSTSPCPVPHSINSYQPVHPSGYTLPCPSNTFLELYKIVSEAPIQMGTSWEVCAVLIILGEKSFCET